MENKTPKIIKTHGALFTCRLCGSSLFGKKALREHSCDEELKKRGYQFANNRRRKIIPLQKKSKEVKAENNELEDVSNAILKQLEKAETKSEIKAISDRYEKICNDYKKENKVSTLPKVTAEVKEKIESKEAKRKRGK